MGLPIPEDNLDQYNASDVTNHIENFRAKKYYLIHGNADDNVHYQSSMILSRVLERNDILFRQQVSQIYRSHSTINTLCTHAN